MVLLPNGSEDAPCRRMAETSSGWPFGLTVAYLLPGFIGLAGVAPLCPAVAEWLRPASLGDAGFGAPVYAVLAALAMGMVLNSVRWLLIDHLLAWSGIVPPAPKDYRSLDERRLGAFKYLVESHYRFYQFQAGALVAILWAYPVNRFLKTSPLLGYGTDLGALLLCAVLLAGARDALTKHRQRVACVLGEFAEKEDQAMTNGIDHHGSGTEAKKPSQAKPSDKGQAQGKAGQAGGGEQKSPK